MIAKKLYMGGCVLMLLSTIWCLYVAHDLKQQRDWFHELYTEWDLFEKDYTDDIKNIDRLRGDLGFEKEVSQEWERMAMDALQKSFEWEMKYKEQYTINNIGLVAK